MTLRQTPDAEDELVNVDERVLRLLEDLHTCCPGRVEKYNPVTQEVEVTPLIKKRRYTEEDEPKDEPNKPIVAVPVIFPGGGDWDIVWPLKQNDKVLLVFAHQSLEDWLTGRGDEVGAREGRRHQLSDAIAIPQLRPFGDPRRLPPDDALTIRFKGQPMVTVKESGVELAGNASAVMRGDKAQAFLQGLLTYIAGLKAPPGTAGGPLVPSGPVPTLPADLLSTKVKVGA